jgi:hypothetical protein
MIEWVADKSGLKFRTWLLILMQNLNQLSVVTLSSPGKL